MKGNTVTDPAPLDTLPERDCGSPRKHDEHLLVVHQVDAPEAHMRCPGRETDDE